MNADQERDLLARLLRRFDGIAASGSRRLADRTSRRSLLGRFGAVMAGVGALPMLPVYRPARAEAPSDEALAIEELGDPQECDYWRYCGFSGTLCSCCGGTVSRCPAGAETASVAWVGTCHNPTDGRDYLISYNDCCGKSYCARCECHRSEGDKPVYFPAKSNSILWCFGSQSHAYHCTLARVVGEVDPALVTR